MDDLTDLWLVDTVNLDASDLDVLLDNLANIEGTAIEGILYMTQANFVAFNTAGGGSLNAWDGESGHHVEFVVPGDFDGDGTNDGADFLYWQINDGSPAGLQLWRNNFGTISQQAASVDAVPEPSTLLLSMLGLSAVGISRRRFGK
jgi:hypothetical protein